MSGENSTETYTLPYTKQRASRRRLYHTGNPKPVSYEDPAVWDGEGAYVYLWPVHVDV